MLSVREPAASDQALHALWARVAQLETELAALREKLLSLSVVHDAPRPVVGQPEPPAAEAWRVTMLGSFRVQRNGVDLPPCPSRRGRSIFKFLLASHSFAAAQAVLVDTFWPLAEPATGAHNLQMAVHALRRSLTGWGPDSSDEVVLFRQDRYLLNPELSIELDVERFRQAYARGQRATAQADPDTARHAFEQAQSLYAGAFLSDSPYEDWTADQRAGLEDMQLRLLAHLSRIYVQAHDWEQAIVCCREILAVDGYREDAYRQLMRCHAACGRRAEVIRIFHQCQDRLRRELQVDPALETCRLYHELSDTPTGPKA